MMNLDEFQIPQDSDEAALWLLHALGDPKKKARLVTDKRLSAVFIGHATAIMSRLARRDGEHVLADLLDRAHAEATQHAGDDGPP
jgi:hypothetical protein